MKAPKYILYVDYTAIANKRDFILEISATTAIEALDKASEIIENDNGVYLVRIYEVVKGTRNTMYNRIANLRHGKVYERAEADTIKRMTQKGATWYE